MGELTLENVEAMQVLYINNYIDENDIRKEFNIWLRSNEYDEADHQQLAILEEFILEMDMKDLFRKWLILIFREDNDDVVTPEQITKFVRLFEVK